jgi:starch phosphorylase
LILAGKAHPNDDFGREMVRAMAQFCMHPELQHRIVFLQDYDMVLAQHLAEGVDVWLNTPRRPAEACGTSGMKILCNGGLNLSVRDGWWDEAWNPEVGWQIGNGAEDRAADRDPREADELLDLLETQIIPEFYDRDESGIPQRWLQRVQASMSLLTMRFSSDRMVREYVEQAYIPAAAAMARRSGNDAAIALELCEWHDHLEQNWKDLHFGEVHVVETNVCWQFNVAVYFGEMPPAAVRVELFAEPDGDGRPSVIPMRRGEPLSGSTNGFSYIAEVPASRPVRDYTPRIVPWHPDAFLPSEESWILWHE